MTTDVYKEEASIKHMHVQPYVAPTDASRPGNGALLACHPQKESRYAKTLMLPTMVREPSLGTNPSTPMRSPCLAFCDMMRQVIKLLFFSINNKSKSSQMLIDAPIIKGEAAKIPDIRYHVTQYLATLDASTRACAAEWTSGKAE